MVNSASGQVRIPTKRDFSLGLSLILLLSKVQSGSALTTPTETASALGRRFQSCRRPAQLQGLIMTDSILGRSLITVATFVGLAVPLVGLGMYVSNLTSQIDSSRAEVQSLKGQVAQLQSILQNMQGASTPLRGPKGEKGDQGEPGPRGPAGPQGPAATIDDEALLSVVTRIVDSKLQGKATQSRASTERTGANAIIEPMTPNGCIQVSQIKDSTIITLRQGLEFCDETDRIVAKIKHINGPSNTDHTVFIVEPGIKDSQCSIDNTCRFSWLNEQEYTYERSIVKGNDVYAQLRLNR